MADYSTRLRLALQVTNENPNTWGVVLNTGVFELLEYSVAGELELSLASGNATLTTANGAVDEARAAVIKVTATGGVARTVTIPSVEKVYRINNAGTSVVLVKTSGGTGVSVLQGTTADIYCDGAECWRTGVCGWGKLSSTTPANASTQFDLALTVTGQAFSECLIRFIGAGRSGASGQPTLKLSHDGTTFSSNSITINSGNTSTGYGGLWIPGYRNPSFAVSVTADNLSSDNGLEASIALADYRAALRFSTGISHARIATPSGTFNGTGSVEVWLK